MSVGRGAAEREARESMFDPAQQDLNSTNSNLKKSFKKKANKKMKKWAERVGTN